jgi:hypothetical protein
VEVENPQLVIAPVVVDTATVVAAAAAENAVRAAGVAPQNAIGFDELYPTIMPSALLSPT